MTFNGFNEPAENWSKLPHQFIDILSDIETIGEMKVLIYTLRHTWGYRDEYKKITLDEFQNGRKRRNGSRIDKGTGLSKPTIIDGIKRAVAHGFLFEYVDNSDRARVEKYYSLTEQGLKDFTSDVKSFNTGGKKILHRSEKETLQKDNHETTAPKSEQIKPLHSQTDNGNGGSQNISSDEYGLEPQQRHDDFARLLSVYKNNITITVSRIVADKLDDILTGKLPELDGQPAPIERAIEAIEIAATQNKRNLAYVIGILRKWTADGYGRQLETDDRIVARF